MGDFRTVLQRVLRVLATFGFVIGINPFLATGIAHAATGDVLQTFIPSAAGNGRAVAVDPATDHLFYTDSGDSHIYVTTPGGTPVATLSPTVSGTPIFYAALSWQATSSGGILWAGRYDGSGNVDKVDPVTGAVTPAFHYAFPANDSCYGQFPGFIDGLAYDASDNTLWFGDDAGRDFFHTHTDGTTIASFATPNGLCRQGITASGDSLWLAIQSGPDQAPYEIGQVSKTAPSTLVQSFGVPDGPEGIALDGATFSGKCGLWVHPFGFQTALTAYEVPSNQCTTGGPTASFTYTMAPLGGNFPNGVVQYPTNLNPADLGVDLNGCASTGATTYTWQFTNITSTSHNCQLPTAMPRGMQTVTLTVSNNAGQTNTVTQTINVKDFLVVAAGDSYDSGEGNPDINGINCNTPNGAGFLISQPTSVSCNTDPVWQQQAFSTGSNGNQVCHRSTLADVSQAWQQLAGKNPMTAVSFLHVACSGSVTNDLVAGNQNPQDAHSGLKYSVPSQFSQINKDRNGHPIDALVLSIGGDDIDFSGIVHQCVQTGIEKYLEEAAGATFPLLEDDCGDSGLQQTILNKFNANLSKLSYKLDGLAACIQGSPVQSDVNGTVACPSSKANLNMDPSHVFVMSYPDPARADDGNLCGGLFEYLRSEAWGFAEGSIVTPLNELVGHKANLYGWHIVGDYNNIPSDVNNSNSFLTHGYCATHNWFRHILFNGGDTPADAQLGTYQVQGDLNGAFHPNNEGHQRMGTSIAQAVQQLL